MFASGLSRNMASGSVAENDRGSGVEEHLTKKLRSTKFTSTLVAAAIGVTLALLSGLVYFDWTICYRDIMACRSRSTSRGSDV